MSLHYPYTALGDGRHCKDKSCRAWTYHPSGFCPVCRALRSLSRDRMDITDLKLEVTVSSLEVAPC